MQKERSKRAGQNTYGWQGGFFAVIDGNRIIRSTTVQTWLPSMQIPKVDLVTESWHNSKASPVLADEAIRWDGKWKFFIPQTKCDRL
jgi:hypothetical protein